MIDKDRHEAGYQVLRKLHTRPDDPDEIVAREEYLQIRRQIELERADKLSKGWGALFKKPSMRKRLILGFGTQFIAQSTGEQAHLCAVSDCSFCPRCPRCQQLPDPALQVAWHHRFTAPAIERFIQRPGCVHELHQLIVPGSPWPHPNHAYWARKSWHTNTTPYSTIFRIAN